MKKIPIGYENYKEYIDYDMYYVDKTMLIADVVERGGKVNLFIRPRRFGKTLALSMLRTFFELEYDSEGNIVDKARYFAGKRIENASERVLSMMGKHPVIKLSLRSAKRPNYKEAGMRLRDEIAREFNRHIYLEESPNLSEDERRAFHDLAVRKSQTELKDDDDVLAEIGRYATALETLSGCLCKHHGRGVIVLIDEYDVVLENAYFKGFYQEMVDFVRSLFESCLKSNDALEFAAITGCLRISKESIFTGLNHLKIDSVREGQFAEAFGFTETETERMLMDYGLCDRIEEARKWYDGYLFGNTEIYNPWSIIKYVDSIANNGKEFPEPYWANTSSNLIIKDMVWHADEEMRQELDLLLQGGTIEKRIHEDITYDDFHESEDNLWNFLFFTGYMRKVSERKAGRDVYMTMRIPNEEIAYIYENQIRSCFERQVKEADKGVLYRAVLKGDTEAIESYVSALLEKSISVFDSSESFYHGVFLSLLYGVPHYSARSNREEGDGRPDIVLYPERPRDSAIIFELKTRKKFSDMEDGLKEALRQIRDRNYEVGVLEDGYRGVRSYGVCFCKKSCIVGLAGA